MRAHLLLPVLLLAPACTLDEVPPLPVAPPERAAYLPDPYCFVAFSPDEALRLATEEWAARWSVATDCDIVVADGGIPVQLALSIERPDGTQAPGVTSEARDLIQINARSRFEQRARSVGHEMGHALGGDHTGSDGVLSGARQRRDVIDLASLDSVCRSLACGAVSPEVP